MNSLKFKWWSKLKMMPLRVRLILAGAAIAFLPSILVFLATWHQARHVQQFAEKGMGGMVDMIMDSTVLDIHHWCETIQSDWDKTSADKQVRQRDLDMVCKVLRNKRLGETGYVYVLKGTGEKRGCYIVSKDGLRDGENLWLQRDSQGHFTVQEICNKALSSSPGEIVSIRYQWKNDEDPSPRTKMAHVIYFRPWDWVIGVSAYEDDFLSTCVTIQQIGRHSLLVVLVLGMGTLLVSVIVWYIISRIISNKIDQTMTELATEISRREEAQKALEKSLKELEQTHVVLHEHQIQLVQSEKLALLGQLAAGVAHEINNPSAFIMSNLTTLSDYVRTFKDLLTLHNSLLKTHETFDRTQHHEVTQKIQELHQKEDLPFIMSDVDVLLKESQDGISRIKEIVQNLKSFSRLDEAEIKEVDLHEGIDSTIKLLWNELKHKGQIHRKFGRIPHLVCHPGQLNQVFMNLLVNAAQAIPDKGEITVETSANEKFIMIKVSDTGSGISPEHMTRLFTPFFTTKPVGKGTGLGLSISYDIIKKHGGTIQVESKVGEGTTFIIQLPRNGMKEEPPLPNLSKSPSV